MQEQQQSQNKVQKGHGSSIQQIKTQNDSRKSGLCLNCNAELPDEALFCPECGFSPGHCPRCGAPASSSADICQECGAWLLEGQCKFCYAEIPDGALFCPECGKPKDGILCPHCGKLSIFDFCPNCGKPITEEAVAELQHAQDEMLNDASPAEQKTFASNQEARRWFNAHNPSAVGQTPEVEAELARLEALINSEPEPEKTEDETPASPPARKSLFSDRQLASIRKTGAVVDAAIHKREEEERIAEEKRKAEEAERKRKEEERQRQIREAQARKEELERQLRSRGWLCNAYGTKHYGGPNECANPSMGGHWVQ